jgi:hypothetical protein
MANSVDEFVEARVQPEHREIVAAIRQLMREAAPEVREVISYGIPSWRLKRIIAVLNPTKRDITFAFGRGAEFEDRYGLLRGAGKKSRHVKMRSLDQVNREALRYYIEQAVRLDKE